MLVALLLAGALLPAEWTLAGQVATCGRAPQARTFELKSEEKLIDLGDGTRLAAMTLGGRLAPVLEACEGDTVTLRVINAGEMAHGIDAHALRMDTRKFGPVESGQTLVLSGVVETPGAFMFHCAAGPVTDVHIKSGMWGAIVVYPRKRLPKAREVAILQGGIFGVPGADGVIHGNPAMMMRNEPATLTYNGRVEHESIRVKAGELVRVWFVNAGPGIASPHVMGTLFDRVAASGNPKNVERDVQTALVPAGGGAMLEMRLPEDGMYMFCDHDNLRFLMNGFAIPLVAGSGEQAMKMGALTVASPHAGEAISWPAAASGALATALLAAGIFAGSRRLIDFDAALVGYTFACLFATFGIVYRYASWLTKPPTRLFFRRGVRLLMRRPGVLAGAVWSRLIAQDFIWRRGATRWLAHMLIAWGCVLAAMVTFPLVFGWLHFEPGAPGTYRVVAFGFALAELPLKSVAAWLVLRALVVSSFMVIPGVMLAMHRRLRDSGAIAVQRFGRDLLPLLMLFAISATGLMLWVSYEFLHGTWYAVLAQIHAFTVIATLIYLPFGKLFHIFQRPASLGVAAYRAEALLGPQAICPETKQPFASEMQISDLESIAPEVGFDYRSARGGPSWIRLSPAGKRRVIARAQSRAKGGKFI